MASLSPTQLRLAGRQPRSPVPSVAKVERARQAAAQARRLQGEQVGEHVLPVHAGLSPLFPAGGLRAGASYSVTGSTALLAATLSGPTSDGLWCGIVGMPGFSPEAAALLGCDLDRLVFVPHPGRDWVNVVAALVDALSVVVVRPSAQVSDAEAARIGARLRQRGAVLLSYGSWPRSETRLALSESRWFGVGSGHGRLRARRVLVSATVRSGVLDTELWLPDRDGMVRSVEPCEGARFDDPAMPLVGLHEATG